MTFRIIPRLDIKSPNLVKGIRLEGLRVLGKPSTFAEAYFHQGADEMIYQDIVASLYSRNSIGDLVRETAKQIFVPLTVGGGIRSLDDIQTLLRAGADKITINTAAAANPNLITEAGHRFGSQCIVVAIETIRQTNGRWKAFTDNGREHTGLDAYDWAMRAIELGAGELVITSVDREGTRKGFELDFLSKIVAQSPVPVLVHGGAGSIADVIQAARAGASGVVLASVLHYKTFTIAELKGALLMEGISVRQ